MAAKKKTAKKKPAVKKKRAAPKFGSKNELVRKLTKTGNYTYYVTIPKTELEILGWKEHQKLVVKRVGAKLVIEDWEG